MVVLNAHEVLKTGALALGFRAQDSGVQAFSGFGLDLELRRFGPLNPKP